MGQCINRALIHSPLRTVLKPLGETCFVKCVILFFIMLTDRNTLAFYLVRRNESLGVSIKPGLISEVAHNVWLAARPGLAAVQQFCCAVVCLSPVSACTWNTDPSPIEAGEAEKVHQLLLIATQDCVAVAVVTLNKSQMRNKLKGIRPQLMRKKKITSVVLLKYTQEKYVQEYICNHDQGSDCYMFNNSEVLQDMCYVDHLQIGLSCHSFLDWGCVQCSHGRTPVTSVFDLRNNCPSVLVLRHSNPGVVLLAHFTQTIPAEASAAERQIECMRKCRG